MVIESFETLLQRAARGDILPAMRELLRIQDKEGKLVPLVPKPAQLHYFNNRTESDIVLKAAQLGFTTWVQGEFFIEAMVNPGMEVIYTAQRVDSAKRLFEITTRMYHAIPEGIRPPNVSDSTQKLAMDFGGGQVSTIEIGTAGSSSFGRGRPVHRYLATEVGFYEREEVLTMDGIIARIPFGGRRVEESTANGQEGTFHDNWQSAINGTSDLTPHFYAWWWDPGYSIPRDNDAHTELMKRPIDEEEEWLMRNKQLNIEQIAWRRWEARKHRNMDFFQQEFPESAELAFMAIGDSVFDPADIRRIEESVSEPRVARMPDEDGVEMLHIWQMPQKGRRYIISVDQASGEQMDDRSRPIDYQVATIWDVGTSSQMGTFRGHVSQTTFADTIAELYNMYNHALVIDERNLAQYGFEDLLRSAGVLNMYMHPSTNPGGRPRIGWPMNVGTKPLMVDDFKELIEADGAITVRSKNLIHEMFNYRHLGKTKHRMGAAPGGHDDELITAMMAFIPEARRQAMIPFDEPNYDKLIKNSMRSRGVKVF
jgi:hypothetical protein